MVTSPIKDKISTAMKAAMKAKDNNRLTVLRLILADIKQQEVDSRELVQDADVLNILDKMLKKRKESIEQFTAASRLDLVGQEEFEVGIIKEFLPDPLSQGEVTQLINAIIKKTGASSIKDMRQVIELLKAEITGRFDLSEASKLVKESLQK